MFWKRSVEKPWELLNRKWAMTFTGHPGTHKPERLEVATPSQAKPSLASLFVLADPTRRRLSRGKIRAKKPRGCPASKTSGLGAGLELLSNQIRDRAIPQKTPL